MINRLRIRIGSGVHEYAINEEVGESLEAIEMVWHAIVGGQLGAAIWSWDYLGNYAWDVFVDQRKIGHVKAFHVGPKRAESDGPTFWNMVLLVVCCYIALL